MARAESRAIMGYLKIDDQHHDAILSLVSWNPPMMPKPRILDPFAGEGEFLQKAARHWGMEAYANELDAARAGQCVQKFGIRNAVQGDVERLSASAGAFAIGWFNPPYDHDAAADAGDKRIEFRYLRHSWKWIQDGGIVMWVIYRHHLTEKAAAWLAKNSRRVDVWALPGKHLGEYDQIIVVAIKSSSNDTDDEASVYRHIMEGKAAPRLLTVQSRPVYRMPRRAEVTRFVFAPNHVDEEQGLHLIEQGGAWKSNGFQALLEPPPPPKEIEPVVPPRPGHMALVLAAGVADGAVITTEEYGTVAIRGKTVHVEEIRSVDVTDDPESGKSVTKTTIRQKPQTTLTLLSADGTTVQMEGDEALLNFITTNKRALAQYLNHKFTPAYEFDMNGLSPFLDRIRLHGKHSLFTAQKHVVAAITKGFERRKGILLSGQMGVGKTVIGGAVAVALATGQVAALASEVRPDQVTLIVCPPHLINKWKRELLDIAPHMLVERLDRHEDVKTFMEKATRVGGDIPKIGLIKRDLTKLGAGREVAVNWHTKRRLAYIHRGYGMSPYREVKERRVPICPTCGSPITRTRDGEKVPASQKWLSSGNRHCESCGSALWQQKSERSAKRKNPRYRLDEYIKRQYPDRVYLLIWDEVHEAANADTGNGEAFGRLAGVAKKVLAMTGTPFNGRASSLFNLEYHLNARVRQRYPWGGTNDPANMRGAAESRWVADMGVREKVVEERPSYDYNTGKYTGTSTYERPYEEAPGVSPLLVAEMLDHTVFFALADLGKALPEYEEVAVPVVLDDDIKAEYDDTLATLKDYMRQRRTEGDPSFRGAYLQWAMGWLNAAFRPMDVIHNRKDEVTGKKSPYIVTSIPSYGEGRVYAKEQALIDLVREELAAGRPCVIYLRQTQTRDIQPRIEALMDAHVTEASPYILRNTVSADRRERTIEKQYADGMNILIVNPELVRTGLDLLFAPTLIFFEVTFNLSTLMQASARSYRLNQTHPYCKVFHLFAEGTMEHQAVQLMSRKQRAAKILAGDVGLTGLEALTEGEASFEEALLQAIAREEALIDASQMFVGQAGEIDQEDATYWNPEEAVREQNANDPAKPSEAAGAPFCDDTIQNTCAVTETPQLVSLFDLGALA